VNREHRAFDDTYWRERNDMSFEDLSIQRYLPSLAAETARLMALPGIAELHADACARHRARRDQLLEQAEYQAMKAQIMQAGTMSPAEEALLAVLGLPPLPSPFAEAAE
jgi:hypothetical protein